MDEIFLGLRSVLFAQVFLVLKGQHGKCTLPCAETDRLADPLVALFPHLIVSHYLPGSIGGGVNDAGGVCANGSAVVCPDAAVMRRTVLVVDAAL